MPELPKESGLPKLDTVGLLGLYKQMAVIRRLEEQAAKAYTQRKILGFCHLYIGQESVAVGAASATMDDYWLAAYREHGQALAQGITPRAVMAELFGKATGCSKGLGGSMHLYDKSVRFLGGYGIVGAHVPLANGVGWAIKQRKEGRVCVCFLGDGAANQGAFFEALCLAQLYKLPVVFLVENNGYAISVPLSKQMPTPDVADRAKAYGIPGIIVDGRDPIEAYVTCREAVSRARAGEGPTIIEAKVQRLTSHSSDDDEKRYRPEEEIAAARKEDCNAVFRTTLEEMGVLKPGDAEEIRAEMVRELDKCMEEAEAAPAPEPESALLHVYKEGR